MNQTNKSSTVFTLVDFSSFTSLSTSSTTSTKVTPAQYETAKEIHNINKHHGFVCLRNSGIPKHHIQSTFDISKKLFELDYNIKNKSLKQINPISNTGYVGYQNEALNCNRKADLKEAFNIRHTSFDNDDLRYTPPMLDDITKSLWEDLKLLGTKFAICCAIALGLDDIHYFSKTLETMDLCTLRMLHYPPCNDTDITENGIDKKESCSIRVGEHTDFGIFTFLFIHDFHDTSSLGLQVKTVDHIEDETQSDHVGSYSDMSSPCWSDFTFDKKSLELIDNDDTCAVIVNTGALMARWTNDIWRATAHRVIVKPESFPFHRYSIAMFFDPDKETLCSVHPKFIEEGHEPKYGPIRSIDYLLMKLKEAQEVKRM